jgi:hypothetical protein
VTDEVGLGQPPEALLVDNEVRARRRRRSATEKGAERLALVDAEGGDVDRPTTFGASTPSAVMIRPP